MLQFPKTIPMKTGKFCLVLASFFLMLILCSCGSDTDPLLTEILISMLTGCSIWAIRRERQIRI
jgi:hypothetical protein